jgi:hypothetical protein
MSSALKSTTILGDSGYIIRYFKFHDGKEYIEVLNNENGIVLNKKEAQQLVTEINSLFPSRG